MPLEKEEFNKFVEDVFRQEYMRIINPEKYSELEFKAYLEKHLFFITLTFSIAFNSNSRNAQKCIDSFRGVYMRLLKSLLGSHYSRKLPLQPLVFYCVDNEGSRHGVVNLVDGENLHIHALILFHPQTMKVWKLVEQRDLRGSDSTIDGLSFSPYDADRGSVKNLVSYASKAAWREGQSISYDFLPKNISRKISAMENRNASAASSALAEKPSNQIQLKSGQANEEKKRKNDIAIIWENSRKGHYKKKQQKMLRNKFKHLVENKIPINLLPWIAISRYFT